MQFHEGVYHFYDESCGRDLNAAMAALHAGSFVARPREVVVRADETTAVYVMPEEMHARLVRRAYQRVVAIAAAGRRLVMPSTALHRNESQIAPGMTTTFYTFGNFTGANAVLFSADAHASFPELAGKKLKNVRVELAMPHPGVATIASFEWEPREE